MFETKEEISQNKFISRLVEETDGFNISKNKISRVLYYEYE